MTIFVLFLYLASQQNTQDVVVCYLTKTQYIVVLKTKQQLKFKYLNIVPKCLFNKEKLRSEYLKKGFPLRFCDHNSA